MIRSYLLLLVLAYILPNQVSSAEVVDGVAAVVNQRVITYGQVRDYVEPVAYQLRRSYRGEELREKLREAQIDALNRLIERALILDDYQAKGFSIPEKVIEKQITDIIAEEFGGKRIEFIKALQEQHMTLTQYREQVRDRIIVQAMLNRKTDREIVISPYKIEKYYKDHVADFNVETHIKLRMIFVQRGAEVVREVKPEAPVSEITEKKLQADIDEEIQKNSEQMAQPILEQGMRDDSELVDVLQEDFEISEAEEDDVEQVVDGGSQVDPRRIVAEEILHQLDDGVSFDSLARKYSEGSEAKDGGDWGWVSKDHLRAELNEIAFALQPGEYSRVIETEIGYYILQVEEVRPAYTKSLADVREEIEKILLQQQREKMQVEWIDQLRMHAYVRLF